MRSDAQANRALLIDTAARLFVQHGDAVSMRSIAKEAGVGMGTLYRHFPDRDALIFAIGTNTFAKVRTLAASVSSAEQFDEFVEKLAEIQLGALIPILTLVRREGIPQEIWDDRQRTVREIERAVAIARDAGVIREDVTATRLLIGLLMSIRPLPDNVPVDFSDELAWVRKNFIRSLKA